MSIQKNKKPLKNFVPIPRKIKDDYLNWKLTQNEFDVLVWIWFNANPINGFCLISYEGLRQDLRNTISYDNARKIISSLRKKEYIYFLNHKGRKGSFPVYPVGFLLPSKEIQGLDYLKNKLHITTKIQSDAIQNPKPENNSRYQYHNFKEGKKDLIEQSSIDKRDSQITTSNNDNDTKINNLIGNKKSSKKSDNRFSSNEKIIPVDTFNPKNYEQEKCLEIAKVLGEKDLRYLLSRLNKYGLPLIENVWGVYKHDINKEKIKNPPAYFNFLLEKEIKKFNQKI